MTNGIIYSGNMLNGICNNIERNLNLTNLSVAIRSWIIDLDIKKTLFNRTYQGSRTERNTFSRIPVILGTRQDSSLGPFLGNVNIKNLHYITPFTFEWRPLYLLHGLNNMHLVCNKVLIFP